MATQYLYASTGSSCFSFLYWPHVWFSTIFCISLERENYVWLLPTIPLGKLSSLTRMLLAQLLISLHHLQDPHRVSLLPPNHTWSLSPRNSDNPLFVGCLSIFFSFCFCITFLWLFGSCPKWTMCSLVLGIMPFSYCDLSQRTSIMRTGTSYSATFLSLKICMDGFFFFPFVPILDSNPLKPLIWHIFLFKWFNLVKVCYFLCTFFIYVTLLCTVPTVLQIIFTRCYVFKDHLCYCMNI